MNSHSANDLTFARLLETLGINLTDQKGHASYQGVIKDSRKVHLIRQYLEGQGNSCAVSDAERWIKNILGNSPRISPIGVLAPESRPEFKLTVITPIVHTSLIQLLGVRGILLELGQSVLKQARIYNRSTKKHFYALAHGNEDDGIIITSDSIDTFIGSNEISFIRGSAFRHGGIHIFKNIYDYLSAISRWHEGEPIKDDSLILNSLSLLSSATPYIKGYRYQYAFTWMSNDEQGQLATKSLDDFFKTEQGLKHQPMNGLYAPHKDVNAWHVAKLELEKGA